MTLKYKLFYYNHNYNHNVIKESVRKAGFAACRILTNTTLCYCDPSVVSIAKGEKIMAAVVPYLLDKGLQSSAEDISKYSLGIVLQLCKQAKVLLKAHITQIVTVLLESMSALEPQMLNYLSFHVGQSDNGPTADDASVVLYYYDSHTFNI